MEEIQLDIEGFERMKNDPDILYKERECDALLEYIYLFENGDWENTDFEKTFVFKTVLKALKIQLNEFVNELNNMKEQMMNER